LGFVVVLLLVVTISLQTGAFGRGTGGAFVPTGGQSATPPVNPSGTPNPVSPEPSASQSSGQALQLGRRDPNDPLAFGALDAPVVLTEWADFRCPYCAVFSRETFPVVLAEYVDTGKVRFEFNDVAFFGDQSVDAAIAVRAAGEQGKFREYMTALFAAAPESGHADLPEQALVQFAEQVEVPDLKQFKADLGRADLRQAVLDSTALAQQSGISSVPFFVAGEQQAQAQALSGAQPLATFRQFLDQQLAGVGG
jgi:protein-disulfide isomerase